MDVKIKITLNFSVSDSSLEDALAEYDELTVEGLVREILDKAIACDEIVAKVVDGPNTPRRFLVQWRPLHYTSSVAVYAVPDDPVLKRSRRCERNGPNLRMRTTLGS